MAYILVNLPKNRSSNSPLDEFVVNSFDNTEELFFTFLKNNFEYDCPETYNIPKYNSIRIEQLPDNTGLYAVKEDEDLRNELFRAKTVNLNSDGSTRAFVFKNVWTAYSALENTKITTGSQDYYKNALKSPYMPVCTDIIVTESSIDNNTVYDNIDFNENSLEPAPFVIQYRYKVQCVNITTLVLHHKALHEPQQTIFATSADEVMQYRKELLLADKLNKWGYAYKTNHDRLHPCSRMLSYEERIASCRDCNVTFCKDRLKPLLNIPDNGPGKDAYFPFRISLNRNTLLIT